MCVALLSGGSNRYKDQREAVEAQLEAFGFNILTVTNLPTPYSSSDSNISLLSLKTKPDASIL